MAEDIGVHQLERLVELLTVKDCEELLFTLSHPEENIFERISPGTKQPNVQPQAKRRPSSAVG